MVTVRIIPGLRHQIRVRMHHFLKARGNEIGEQDDFGIISDSLYLHRGTYAHDTAQVCERVFLHERMLGM